MAPLEIIDLTCQDTDIIIIESVDESELHITYENLPDVQIIEELSSHKERKSRRRRNDKGNRRYRKKRYEDLSDVQIIKDPYKQIEREPKLRSNQNKDGRYRKRRHQKMDPMSLKRYLINDYRELQEYNKYNRHNDFEANGGFVDYKLQSGTSKLSSSNKGFEILSKLGWKEGEGLGVDGQGIKYPVKVHHQDHRRGLGN